MLNSANRYAVCKNHVEELFYNYGNYPPPSTCAFSSDRNACTHRKPRIFYLDLIRAIAVIFVVIAHFQDPYLFGKHILPLVPFGIYIGGLGVSLFLIISGASLMYTYEDDQTLSLKTFYYRRAKALYPSFWLAFIIAYVWLRLHNVCSFDFSAHPERLLLSIIGMDGYCSLWGVQTFYILGEWFLGLIILFYLVFPIMRIGVKKHPACTTLVIMLLYIGTNVTFSLFPHPTTAVADLVLTARLPELLFGMLFIRYIKTVPKWVIALSITYLITQQVVQPLKDSWAVTLVGITMYFLLVALAQCVARIKPAEATLCFLSRISYEIFLVHHVIIQQVFSYINPSSLNRFSAVILFFIVFCSILAASKLLQSLSKLCQKTVHYILIERCQKKGHNNI